MNHSTVEVIHSVAHPQHLLSFFCRRFGWSKNSEIRLLKTGINHTYAIQSGDQSFILRVYTHAWKTFQQIQEEVDFLLFLKEKGIAVSVPLADLDHQRIHSLDYPEGQRYAVIFTFAAGTKQQYYEAAVHREAGAWLGQFHHHSREKRFDSRSDYTASNHWEHLIDPILSTQLLQEPHTIWLKKIHAALLVQLNELPTSSYERGIIHSDFWFDNFHYDAPEITVFDFDFSGTGWLGMDRAYYQMQLRSLEPDEKIFNRKWEAFVEGYSVHHPYNQQEDEALAIFGLGIQLYYLGIQCERFSHWTAAFINEVYLNRYVEVFIGRQAALIPQFPLFKNA
jgi:Ser/Thr protein kinase RdoA (MazF antagonist)